MVVKACSDDMNIAKSAIKTLDIYVKVEDYKAYYVVNGMHGSIDL